MEVISFKRTRSAELAADRLPDSRRWAKLGRASQILDARHADEEALDAPCSIHSSAASGTTLPARAAGEQPESSLPASSWRCRFLAAAAARFLSRRKRHRQELAGRLDSGCSPAARAGKVVPEAALEWIEHGASRASSSACRASRICEALPSLAQRLDSGKRSAANSAALVLLKDITSIDHQDLSGDVGSFRRSEEANRRGHFFRRPAPAKRRMNPDHFF